MAITNPYHVKRMFMGAITKEVAWKQVFLAAMRQQKKFLYDDANKSETKYSSASQVGDQ